VDMIRTVWGSVNADSSIASGSHESGGEGFDFTVTNTRAGVYVVGFLGVAFKRLPAVVATQSRGGSTDEWNTDGVVVPMISQGSATIVTGSADASKQNRSFSFIAIGAVPT
jgi:hypothetical protein